ncbi:MAG: hypothetical protein D6766_11850, partial [Verrucomicrobia bacterium]
MNSASTIFTMDVYHRWLDRRASEGRLVAVGRVVIGVCVLVGCWLAPKLADPKFGGVFQFIQEFQGYLWPGIVAAFVFGMMVDKAPPAAGITALVAGPAIYHLLRTQAGELHFLIHVAVTFNLLLMLMGLITFWRPLAEPRSLPVRAEMAETRTEPVVLVAGWLVIAAVVAFFVVFA